MEQILENALIWLWVQENQLQLTKFCNTFTFAYNQVEGVLILSYKTEVFYLLNI